MGNSIKGISTGKKFEGWDGYNQLVLALMEKRDIIQAECLVHLNLRPA